MYTFHFLPVLPKKIKIDFLRIWLFFLPTFYSISISDIFFATEKKCPERHPRALKHAFRRQTEGNNTLPSYTGFRLFAIAEIGMLLIRIRCEFCQCFFHVCRSCFRGQAYCCDICRVNGKRQKHREAQRRYRKTPKGRKNHREAENRRRQSRKGQGIVKKMDDASSTPQLLLLISLITIIYMFLLGSKTGFSTPRCRFCGARGRVVSVFPRRGYANNRKRRMK